ncbi:MAG: extracellular solute-binding protein, partial [Candidatus Promineifilaceae bacterium]
MKISLIILLKKLTPAILLISILLVACQDTNSEGVTPAASGPIGENIGTDNPSVSNGGSINVVPGGAPLNDPITISLLVDDYELVTYENLVDSFEADNPDITIKLITANDILGDISTTATVIERQLKLAENADVLVTHTTGAAIRAGLRMDMAPFIAADNSFDPNDFYAGLLEAYQWDGKTWAIPLTSSFDLLVYNKELFDRANVDYPVADWVWDDLLDAALALTVRENGEVAQWGFADPHFGFTLFPNIPDSLLTAAAMTPQTRFQDPAFVAKVQWYTDLFVTHQVAPYPSGDLESLSDINTFLSELHNLVQTDKVAMWVDSSTFLTDSFIPPGANWGISPLPDCSPAYAGTVSISAGTQNPEAAWRLVRFLSQQFVVAGSVGDLPQMPARRSVAEAGGFYNEVNSELTNALRYAVANACPMYQAYESFGANEAFSAFQIAVGDILAGNKSVSTALSDAQATAETNINELVETQAQATPIPPFTVSTTLDTTVSNQTTTAVTFKVIGGADEVSTIQQIAQQFMADHPGIAIEVTAVQGDATLASSAFQASCFQSAANFTMDELNAVLSLDPLLDADPDLAAHDFYAPALEAFSANGR